MFLVFVLHIVLVFNFLSYPSTFLIHCWFNSYFFILFYFSFLFPHLYLFFIGFSIFLGSRLRRAISNPVIFLPKLSLNRIIQYLRLHKKCTSVSWHFKENWRWQKDYWRMGGAIGRKDGSPWSLQSPDYQNFKWSVQLLSSLCSWESMSVPCLKGIFRHFESGTEVNVSLLLLSVNWAAVTYTRGLGQSRPKSLNENVLWPSENFLLVL